MGYLKDLTGMKVGRWTVVKYAGVNKHHRALWECHCQCGNTGIVSSDCLIRGSSNSCGCWRDEVLSRTGIESCRATHGMSHTRIYHIWKSIRNRCENTHNKDYQRWYGSKGIKVCDEWDEFESFYEWAMANGYHDNLTIDRIDPTKDYCPENCRWATAKEQANNKCNTRRVTINGETHTLSEWADISGLPLSTVRNRWYRGITGSDLLQPKRR